MAAPTLPTFQMTRLTISLVLFTLLFAATGTILYLLFKNPCKSSGENGEGLHPTSEKIATLIAGVLAIATLFTGLYAFSTTKTGEKVTRGIQKMFREFDTSVARTVKKRTQTPGRTARRPPSALRRDLRWA
jgi:hypothetical protein